MIINNNDLYRFANENEGNRDLESKSWKVLISDPDEDFHKRIKDQCKAYRFEDKAIAFLDAYSDDEVKKTILDHPDLSIIMTASTLDIKYLRETLNNHTIRIILLTDHMSTKNEIQFILDYDISSCMHKNEESDSYVLASVLTAFRSYRYISVIEKNKGLNEEIIIAANRFVPQSFLRILKKDSIVNVQLDNYVEKNLTILFLDIRSFTSLSEFLTPVETFQFINNCMSYLEPHIIRNNGFIDKYIGDALMALFPLTPDDAVTAAIQMLKSLESYNADRIMKQQLPINIGIGINTGKVVIGTVGFHDRLECTVIGDAVNLASRVEKMNKLFGTNLLISEQTFLNLNDPEKFNYRSLGKYQIHGKKQLHTIYEIFDANLDDVLKAKKTTLSEFSRAVTYFQNNEYIQSQRSFKSIMDNNKHDTAASFFLEKINSILNDKNNSS